MTAFGKILSFGQLSVGTLGLLVATVISVGAADALLDDWQDMIPRGNDLGGIVYGDGKFISIGANGELLFSTNAAAWQHATAPSFAAVKDVTFGNGMFLAVGTISNQVGGVLRSADGVNWTSDSVSSSSLYACAFGNGVFVADDNRSLLTSADGIQWTSLQMPVYRVLNGVDFVNDHFVAMGATGFTVTSPDGITWTTSTNNAIAGMRACAYGNGTTVMVGGNGSVNTVSSNASAIFSVAPGSDVNFQDVVYGNGRFVAVGSFLYSMGVIYTSTNGFDWEFPFFAEPRQFSRVSFANGEFVAVGGFGAVLTSTDGLNWTVRRGGTSGPLVSIAALDDRVVAVGGSFNTPVITLGSTDQETWQIQQSAYPNDPNRIINANDHLFVVGTLGYISTSPDGTNWTSRGSAITNWMSDLIYSEGLYLAIGAQGSIEVSSDGVVWTNHSFGSHFLSGVTHGLGLFAAVGYDGTIVTSPDAASWNFETTGTTNALHGVACGDNTFVAVGDGGTILRSTNGHAWTLQASPLTNGFQRVCHVANRFVAVGEQGAIISSTDGIAWQSHPPVVTETLRDIILAHNRLWVVGDAGTILISKHDVFPVLGVVDWSPEYGCEMKVPTNLGRPWRLQFTIDGDTWQDLQTYEPSNTNETFFDNTATNQPIRFYRGSTD
jgi:hypothetical protein